MIISSEQVLLPWNTLDALRAKSTGNRFRNSQKSIALAAPSLMENLHLLKQFTTIQISDQPEETTDALITGRQFGFAIHPSISNVIPSMCERCVGSHVVLPGHQGDEHRRDRSTIVIIFDLDSIGISVASDLAHKSEMGITSYHELKECLDILETMDFFLIAHIICPCVWTKENALTFYRYTLTSPTDMSSEFYVDKRKAKRKLGFSLILNVSDKRYSYLPCGQTSVEDILGIKTQLLIPSNWGNSGDRSPEL
jgi:hypothetical protein